MTTAKTWFLPTGDESDGTGTGTGTGSGIGIGIGIARKLRSSGNSLASNRPKATKAEAELDKKGNLLIPLIPIATPLFIYVRT